MAGYQNREKIAEWIKTAQQKIDTSSSGSGAPAAGNPPGQLGGLLAGTSIGDMLSAGLRNLVDGLKQAGHGEVADSWVSRGTGDRAGGACDLVSAHRIISRRDTCEALEKSPRRRGQVYTRRPNPEADL
jgi:uncharacterized protein YidB (DUF937 family)